MLVSWLLIRKSIGPLCETPHLEKSLKLVSERNPYNPTACIQIWCMIRDANWWLAAKVAGNFHSMEFFGQVDGRALLDFPRYRPTPCCLPTRRCQK